MLKIREATLHDAAALFELKKELAEYHNQIEHLKTNVKSIIDAGFANSTNRKFEAVVVEDEGILVGYITYTYNYSIWNASQYMNIDDVYVREDYRGFKVGEKIMQHVRNICIQNNIEIMKWELESSNKRAEIFYKRLGSKLQSNIIAKWKTKKTDLKPLSCVYYF